jgi:hypothetical protein
MYMDAVTILGLFCLISAGITYGLGIYVYAKNPESRVNRLFLMVSIGASYWGIGEFQIWSVNSYDNVLFWLKASSFWTVVIVMCIILSWNCRPSPCKTRESEVPSHFLYIPAFLRACVNNLTDHIFSVQYSPDSDTTMLLPSGTRCIPSPPCIFLPYSSGAVYIGLQARRSAEDTFNGSQAQSASTACPYRVWFPVCCHPPIIWYICT